MQDIMRNMHRLFVSIVALCALNIATAQPKLAINIVVSSMKATDIERYSINFSQEGFMRLYNGGASFTECYTDFVPTSSQMCLATIATGAQPSMHGIASTQWHDRTAGNTIIHLCQDSKGNYTTDHFTAPTLAQTLATSERAGRVVTTAHNASSAMILAGKQNECYWIDSIGNWSTANCYAKSIPDWLNAQNEISFNRSYVRNTWFGKLSKSRYINTRATDIAIYDIYSKPKNSDKKPIPNWVNTLMTTPAANNAIFTLAKKIVDQMVADKRNDDYCDMLTICLDAPREIAQKYGPDSIEYEDMLYCLDANIAELMAHIDAIFPRQSDYLITLTSDRGIGQINPKDFNTQQAEVILNAFLSAQYGQGKWVLSCNNGSIYLNRDQIYSKKLSIAQVQNEAATFVMQFRGIANTATATALQGGIMSSSTARLMQNAFYPRRCGDILYCLQPDYYQIDEQYVAQSGSPYNHDRHIPLIFYGAGIESGKIERKVSSSAIAVSTAAMLGITRPNCADGDMIYELKHR